MSDPTKQYQRNIRIADDLWAYVKSLAQKGHTRHGDCSAVIRDMIKAHQASHTPDDQTQARCFALAEKYLTQAAQGEVPHD